MIITFSNELGTVTFTGGGDPSHWCITALEGIGIPEYRYTYHTYAGQDGQALATCAALARVISLRADADLHVCAVPPREAARIFSQNGVLVLTHEGRVRAISCRVTAFTKPERAYRTVSCVVQFTADDPYFSDPFDTTVTLSERVDCFRSPFTLPCAFSTRLTEADVYNVGDAAAEPVLTFTADGTEESVTFRNETTGAQIEIQHLFQAGETLTLDIPNRKVISSVEGFIPHALSAESVLSSFVLTVGKNRLRILGTTGQTVCVFRNRYREAMY